MRYYKQHFKTDCLLAAAENFVQKPRTKFGKLKWIKKNGDKYLRYGSLCKILRKYKGGADLVFDGTVILDKNPAILGWIYTYGGRRFNHALFWDGEKAFCPFSGSFVDLSKIDVSYCVVSKKHENVFGKRHKNFKEVCDIWDQYCLNKETQLKNDYEIENLMTLSFNGQVYPGNPKRANTDRNV